MDVTIERNFTNALVSLEVIANYYLPNTAKVRWARTDLHKLIAQIREVRERLESECTEVK